MSVSPSRSDPRSGKGDSGVGAVAAGMRFHRKVDRAGLGH
jgi:hypothetical protein